MVLHMTSSEECLSPLTIYSKEKESQFEGRRLKRKWLSSSLILYVKITCLMKESLWTILLWQVGSLLLTMLCVSSGLDVMSSCTYTPCCYPMLATTIHSTTFQTDTFDWRKDYFIWESFKDQQYFGTVSSWLVSYIRLSFELKKKSNTHTIILNINFNWHQET